MMYLDSIDSPVGPLIVGASEEAICLLEFADQERLDEQMRDVSRRFACAITPGTNGLLDSLRCQLAEYFADKRRNFELPLRYSGTPFQEKVWSALLRIPYGETWSYLELARTVGDANATRAVGSANGTNPLAILIPCHRVVNANGALGGYGGGPWRKRILLDLERGQGQLWI